GIRVFHVTGVQTCALPILKAAILDLGHAAPYDILNFLGEAESVIIAVPPKNDHFVPMMEKLASALRDSTAQIILISSISVYGERSEERRVGKEWRDGWGTE